MISTVQLVELVKKALENKQPFSFVRYGDGESMVLDNDSVDFILKRQLGYVPENIDTIINSLKDAYFYADIIGAPTYRHLTRNDSWSPSIRILKEKVPNYFDENNFASIDACYEMLECGDFDDLLQDREDLVYISCRDLGKEFKKKYNIKNIQSYIIAPEMKFTSSYFGKQHYPDQFNEIEKWIGSIDCKGKLCLVGAGVVGKIYNIWFKNNGGISLDVGAVFDRWAGRCTRGKNRGKDVIDNTYKL